MSKQAIYPYSFMIANAKRVIRARSDSERLDPLIPNAFKIAMVLGIVLAKDPAKILNDIVSTGKEETC